MKINKIATKKYILERFATKRPHLGITRVSAHTFEILDAKFRNMIDAEIDRCPSTGQKTFSLVL